MLAGSRMRSSALARAEAQLAGRRVPVKPKDSADELQEYMRALSKKTSALKLSHPSIADLSDLSLSEQESEKYKRTVSPQQSTGTQSRFLKKKGLPGQEDTEGSVKPASEAAKLPLPQPVPTRTPTSAALRRLAEFESRHRSRKLELDISENDSDLRTSEERPYSNRSSSDFSTRGHQFLKKKVNIKEPEPVGQVYGAIRRGKSAESKVGDVESEEEEIRHLIGSSAEYSENDDRWRKVPKPPRTPSPPSRPTSRRNLHRSPTALGFISPRRPPSCLPSRTPSPPSHGTPRYPRRTHSLTRFGSPSPSASVRSSLTNSSPRARLGRRSRTPLSQRSDLKSLDELFSRADDPSTSSSNDFKLNIMSLDELVPAIDTDEPGEKKAIKEKPVKKKKSPSTEHKKESHHEDGRAFRRPKSSSDEDSAPEVHTETFKSEVPKSRRKALSRSSSEESLQEWPNKTTVQSSYSEDFEDSVPSETRQSPESDSQSYSKSISSEYSISTSHSHPHSNQKPQKKRVHKIQRVNVRDTSVQTNDAAFTYHWPQGIGSIDLAPVGTSILVEPVSLANHVVSPGIIEAMTTYSPAALALNDMLKQQVFLTRSFVDMARQLYLSTMKSLDCEMYQYTTLEDTQKYIEQQKSAKWKSAWRDVLTSHSPSREQEQ
ncbi:uncharacterized protein C19orf44 homolog isoform X2 [Hyperolius riggenbachi]